MSIFANLAFTPVWWSFQGVYFTENVGNKSPSFCWFLDNPNWRNPHIRNGYMRIRPGYPAHLYFLTNFLLNLVCTYGILKPVWKPQPIFSATSSCGYNWRHFHSSLTLIVVRPSSHISSTFTITPSPNGRETWVGGGWTTGLVPIIRPCWWWTQCLHPFITRCLGMVDPTSSAIVRVQARHPVAGIFEIKIIASPFVAILLAWDTGVHCEGISHSSLSISPHELAGFDAHHTISILDLKF